MAINTSIYGPKPYGKQPTFFGGNFSYLPRGVSTIGQTTVAYQAKNFKPFAMITGTKGGGIQTKEGVARSFSVATSPRRRIRPKINPTLHKPTQTMIGKAAFKKFHTSNIKGPRITTQGMGAVDKVRELSDNKTREARRLFKPKVTKSGARLTGRPTLGGSGFGS